ncbi:MAG: hypothetical protein ACRENM_04585 [Candidatus Dormibacteraceae bacterium]
MAIEISASTDRSRMPTPRNQDQTPEEGPKLRRQVSAAPTGNMQLCADVAWDSLQQQRASQRDGWRVRQLIARSDQLMSRLEDKVEAGMLAPSPDLALQIGLLARASGNQALAQPSPRARPAQLQDHLFVIQEHLLKRKTGEPSPAMSRFDSLVERRARRAEHRRERPLSGSRFRPLSREARAGGGH